MIQEYITPNNLIVFVFGAVFGAIVVFVINLIIKGKVKDIAQELLSEAETQKLQDLNTIIIGIKDSFGALSFDALSKNTDEFLKLANERFSTQTEVAKETLSKQTELGGKELEKKKELIDLTLMAIKEELSKIQNQVTTSEKDREQKYGELANQLKVAEKTTLGLQETTNKLRETLANAKLRGQWGERMAEDILALIGMQEGVNYFKQKKLDTDSTIPDYTFVLPNGLKVNMDVKFPFANYLKFVEAETESEKESYRSKFLKDVKDRVKEVTGRSYINPEENTIDYVIVFIPNEQVYCFIHENDDNDVIDSALKSKVILCSPITLYAILAIMRQAVENFNLQKATNEMLSLYGAFKKQWDNYIRTFENLGDKIEDIQGVYVALTSTRTNKVDLALRRIDELRNKNSIPIADLSDGNVVITMDEQE